MQSQASTTHQGNIAHHKHTCHTNHRNHISQNTESYIKENTRSTNHTTRTNHRPHKPHKSHKSHQSHQSHCKTHITILPPPTLACSAPPSKRCNATLFVLGLPRIVVLRPCDVHALGSGKNTVALTQHTVQTARGTLLEDHKKQTPHLLGVLGRGWRRRCNL